MEGGFFLGWGGGGGGVVGHSEESTSPTFECFVVWKEKIMESVKIFCYHYTMMSMV